MNIRDFKNGDVIVRTEPAKPYPSRYGTFGELVPGTRDRSYLGEPLKFGGIANNHIYVKGKTFLGSEERISSLPLDLWEDGWELYEDPAKFFIESN